MRLFLKFSICIALIFTGCNQPKKVKEKEFVKVACVGNSITYGMGVANREKNAYPAQLQRLLGNDYQVENFGISSRTLLKKGNKPYWESDEYKKALAFNADIVLIKLGSNDAKQINRGHLNEFEKDYKELIQSFKEKNKDVRIMAMLPITSFVTDTTYIWDPVIKNRIIPKVKKVAKDTKSELVDLYELFKDKSELLPDKVHPSSLGATLIAKKVYEAIIQKDARDINYAVLPMPASEYRSGAGWKKGKGWWYQMEDIDSLASNSGKLDILLIGNSITQSWGGSRTLTSYKPGQGAANIHFKNLNWVNAGISGDRTEHIAWRIKNGHYNVGTPKLVTLAIGVNNFAHNTAEEIAKGTELNIELIKEKLPNSKILFFGPLPTGLKTDSEKRKKYNKIHKLIKQLDSEKNVYYHNIINLVSDENGDLNTDYYSSDEVHLISKGYNVWGKFIREKYNELIKK